MIDRDSRYRDILGIPSGFSHYPFGKINIRPFEVRDLMLLNFGVKLKTIVHVKKAIQATIDVDVDLLTDGDFEYILGWHKMFSFPKAPVNVTWTCGELQEGEVCGNKNVYMSHNARVDVKMLETSIPDGLTLPKVGTLEEAEDLAAQPKFSKIVDILRVVDCEGSLEDRYEFLKGKPDLFKRARAFSKLHTHGMVETLPLWCSECDARTKVVRPIDKVSFLGGHTENSLMDMQYNLASALHMNPDDSMPSMKLLYIHSCFVKDMQEKRERQKAENTIKAKRRRQSKNRARF
tara:strand:- start:1292 stop:2164 length:873 start_codon:yes stop_codon:yes gene_type:complete